MGKAKQRTLSFKLNGGEEVISRPFDFEAMCLMNDIHSQGDKGKFTICMNAVPYMFEGTKVTDKVLKNAGVTELGLLCDTLWGIYCEELVNLAKAKNDEKNTESPTEN